MDSCTSSRQNQTSQLPLNVLPIHQVNRCTATLTHVAVGVWSGVSGQSGVSSVSGVSSSVWVSSVSVDELRVSFSFTFADEVGSSIGVVKSIVGYYWGSNNGGLVDDLVDLWEGIPVVSVGVNSVVVEVLGISFSFTLANIVDTSGIGGNWGSV